MHAFFQLREQLPALSFDPARDSPTSQQPWLKEYLAYYQLEFPEEICRHHVVGTFEASNFTIVAQYWIPALTTPKGTVFILHGYYDHVGLFNHAIEFILSQGFVVVAYDQPGHGLSSGERASINHFSEYVKVLEVCLKKSDCFPRPWYGLGQSTGGAVLLHAILIEKMTNVFIGMILLAPLIRPAGWNKSVWTYRLLRFFIKKIPRHFSHNSNDEKFVHFCHDQDPLQSRYLSVKWVGAMKEWLDSFNSLPNISAPVLLIQGDVDSTVDWRCNVAMLKEKIAGMQYYELQNACHHLVNEREDIRQQLFARIAKFLLASR